MHAQLFYGLIAIAVILTGILAFLIGGSQAKVKLLKAKGQIKEAKESARKLIRLGVIVGGTYFLIVIGALSGVLSFSVSGVSISTFKDPVSFVAEVLIFNVLAGIIGWWIGEAYAYEGEKVITGSKAPVLSAIGPFATMAFFILFAFHMGGIAPAASAASLCITEQMAPVTELMNWAATSLVPIVIVLILALVPLIFIMLGVKFAANILSDVLSIIGEIRSLFSFR